MTVPDEKKNENKNILLGLSEKHGVSLSPMGMECAQNIWSNLEEVSDHINSLHKDAHMMKGNGKINHSRSCPYCCRTIL